MQNDNLHMGAALKTLKNLRALIPTSLFVLCPVHHPIGSFFNPVQTLEFLHAATSLKKTRGQHLLLQHLGEGFALLKTSSISQLSFKNSAIKQTGKESLGFIFHRVSKGILDRACVSAH